MSKSKNARVFKSISDVAGILTIVLFFIVLLIVGDMAPEGFKEAVNVFATLCLIAVSVFSLAKWKSSL